MEKLQTRIDLLKNATKKSGGVYLYSNMEGGDGDRLWFDGRSMIAMNGQILNIEDETDFNPDYYVYINLIKSSLII